MRLHLPKGLLAALLAACFALPAGAEGEPTTQYGWNDASTSAAAGPATSTNGITWTNITYDAAHTLSSFTDGEGNQTYTLALDSLGDVKITDVPVDSVGNNNYCGWGTGFSVTGTANSAWFSMTGNERIYLSCPDISKISNVYLNGIHFVIGTNNPSKDTSNTISSNLFLGAGTWSNDSTKVHHKSVLRANVDADITGNVTLTDSSVQISTSFGKDIAFNGVLNGENKTLSIGAEGEGSVIYLNGSTTLGTLSVGTGTNTDENLIARGTGISVVIGENSSTTLGNVSLLSGSTLTNKGSLTITGTYTGGTIKQSGSNASLTLGSTSVVKLDSIKASYNLNDTAGSGIQTYSKSWVLASGGSLRVEEGASYQSAGGTLTGGSMNEDNGTFTSANDYNYYNILSTEIKSYDDVTAAINNSSKTVDLINVSGKLTGLSYPENATTMPLNITGDGTVVATGELQYNAQGHTFLDDFHGTLEIGSNGFLKLGSTTDKLGALSGLKVTAGGSIGGWSNTKPSNVLLELAGGRLTSAGGNMDYKGAIKVTENSTIAPATGTGNTITISGAVKIVAQKTLTITRDNATATGGVTISNIISGEGDLTISGGVVTTLTGNNTFTGEITITGGSTLNLSGSTASVSGSGLVTVETNSVFDLKGRYGSGTLPNVTLAGGTLKNSGSGKATNDKQLAGISLTANSKIDASSQFGLVNNDHNPATLDLGSYTLTKTGSNIFHAVSTAVTGTGKIRIEEGTFNLESKTGKTASSLADKVNIELAGTNATLSGSFTNNGTSTIHGVQNGTVSALIKNNGTLKVTGDTEKVVTFSNDITNGSTGSAVLQIGDTTAEGTAISGTAKLTAALGANTVSQIKVLNGSSLILYGDSANDNYSGTITVEAGGKLQSTNNQNDQLVNGDSGKLILNGEFTIDSTGKNKVNGISGSGVVKTAQNAILNIDSANSFTGSVASSGRSDKTVTLAFAEGTTASLKSLSATNGSTLNAKGIATVTDTTGGLSVSDLVIGTESTVQAWTGTADTWDETTEATVLMKGTEGAPVTLTVGTAGETGTSTLKANLVLDGATLTLNNALTMGSTLTLNNNITLNGTALDTWTSNTTQALTLFTGVDALTINGKSAETDKLYEASNVFGNLTTGTYSLKYTGAAAGGDVLLIANNPTPEPTTATLSLLALMGLAARRRRKA